MKPTILEGIAFSAVLALTLGCSRDDVSGDETPGSEPDETGAGDIGSAEGTVPVDAMEQEASGETGIAPGAGFDTEADTHSEALDDLTVDTLFEGVEWDSDVYRDTHGLESAPMDSGEQKIWHQRTSRIDSSPWGATPSS